MKKNKRVWNTISWIVFVLLLAVEGWTVFQIWKLRMLPGKFFAIVVAAFVLFTLLISFLMFQRQGKWQKVRHTRQVVAYLLSAVVICGCLFGGGAVARLNEAMSAITSISKVSVLMDVYVRADDPAQTIEDCRDYTFGITAADSAEETEKVLEELADQLSGEVATHSYGDVFSLVNGLYNGEVEAIILNSSYVDILSELDEYSDFSTQVRLINEHVIEKEVLNLNIGGANEGTGERVITKDPFLLYISGNDARKALLANGGSDVNILVAVNPVDKQILLVSTPRDYFVANPAGDGAKDKLSHCGLYGIENSVEAMNQLYGQSIDYYAKINFSGFKTLVDAIGGVTIYIEKGFTSSGRVTFNQGEQLLNGEQALAYVRERKAFSAGDNARGQHQMQVITAMINQLSAGTLIANYADILDSLDGMFATSIPAEDIAKLVSMQLSDMAEWDILSYAVTGDNGSDKPYALNGLYAYVMYPHEEKVAFASGLIDRVLNGEVLTAEDISAG